ncbi:hepatic lectin-like isoform X2 [Contarinia nasturtii]|nr:hepatic lectin-like isoform X2 [Contarinia nasturtii]
MFYPKHKVVKKYHFMMFKANWHKALLHCRSLGMNLVSISSKEENEQVIQKIKDEGYAGSVFWTSGTKLGDNVTWEWAGNGKRVTFTNWAPGEPNNHGDDENCILSSESVWGPNSTQKWNDDTCDYECPFICEQDVFEYEYCSN